MKERINDYYEVLYRLHGSETVKRALFKKMIEAIHFRQIYEHAGLINIVNARNSEIMEKFDRECAETQKVVRKMEKLRKNSKKGLDKPENM